MRRLTDIMGDDYASYSIVPERSIEGPLFSAPEVCGPFDQSPAPTAADKEKGIAALIWDHKGRTNPVSIATIEHLTGYNARAIKMIVEQLRVTHRMPIGALRTEIPGYFWIQDAEDQEIACVPYRRQVLTMFRTLRILDSPHAVRELLGQLTLEMDVTV